MHQKTLKCKTSRILDATTSIRVVEVKITHAWVLLLLLLGLHPPPRASSPWQRWRAACRLHGSSRPWWPASRPAWPPPGPGYRICLTNNKHISKSAWPTTNTFPNLNQHCSKIRIMTMWGIFLENKKNCGLTLIFSTSPFSLYKSHSMDLFFDGDTCNTIKPWQTQQRVRVVRPLARAEQLAVFWLEAVGQSWTTHRILTWGCWPGLSCADRPASRRETPRERGHHTHIQASYCIFKWLNQ